MTYPYDQRAARGRTKEESSEPDRFIKEVTFEKTITLRNNAGELTGCVLKAAVTLWRGAHEEWDKQTFKVVSAVGRKKVNDVLKDELRSMNATQIEREEELRERARDAQGEYLDIGVY